MPTLPESFADLFTPQKRAFAYPALVLKDGSPQVTPVWFDWDGTHLIINTARGRVKDRALQRRARVALAISDPADPYRYIQVQGRVAEETEAGAREMIDQLSQKYEGRPYPWYRGETRVTYKIQPEKFQPEK